MSIRHTDTEELCRQQPGMCFGKLCDTHEGTCPICDSRSNPAKQVKVCDGCAGAERYTTLDVTSGGASSSSEQNTDNAATKQAGGACCIICGKPNAKHIAMYCRACVLLERDRDGCPRVKNHASRSRGKR